MTDEQTRQEIRDGLASGDLTWEALFRKRSAVVGNMDVHSVLVSIPGIGEKRADAILEKFGWSQDRRLDSLDADERKALIGRATSASK